MESYHISGGNPISGEYKVKGSKNATLPILAASIITGQRNYFFNCPAISDVAFMKKILESLGCIITEKEDFLEVDTTNVDKWEIPPELMKEMRSSVFLVGPLLARCGKAVISQPGGCAIGARPIDIHIKALRQLGVTIEEREDSILFTADNPVGTEIFLDFPSVGATENLLTAALGAKGKTVIYNSAKEPEIIDLQNYLNRCGAKITGAGTSKITITPGGKLCGSCHSIMGDRIEAGTFLMAAACTGGELLIRGIDPEYIKSVIKVLKFCGCKIRKGQDDIWLKGPDRLYAVGKIQTKPYPGFPTDLQPQLTAIMTKAIGQSQIEERIFESRFKYTEQLVKMGGNIDVCETTAIVDGVEILKGNQTTAEDLRGGAALVLAGLMAEGETDIKDIRFIERGYAEFHKELCKLGGEVKKIHE